MAWPKLRNHRSPGPSATAGHDAGAAPDGTPSHAVAPDRAERPTWRAREGWPASNPTVTPVPAEPRPSPAEPEASPAAAPEAGTDPLEAPFWESWALADDAAKVDNPGDGLPEEGP